MICISAATLDLPYLCMLCSEAERSEVGLLSVAAPEVTPPFLPLQVRCCKADCLQEQQCKRALFFPFFPPHPGLPTAWHSQAILLS